MMTKKWLLAGILTLLTVSWAMAAPPAVHPVTGQPLVLTCLRGTPEAIDGNLADWNLDAMTPAVLDAAAQIYTGQASWTGVADCSGKFYVMWDDKNIYFAAIVKDDTLVMNKSGADIWNADCAEIFLSTTNAIAGHTEHYQWGFNASMQTWNWENMDGGAAVVPTNLQVVSKRTGDGYICEAALAYAGIKAIKIAAGSTVGLHVGIDDTDATDREIQMTWTGREAHDQSLGFGNLIFSADPALPKGLSRNPNPGNHATDVPVDTLLAWNAGSFAASHDVYFGASLADVNSASRAKPAGLLASQGQNGTTFDPPGSLAYGQTYYWRIDEVNKAPDGTIYKGEVWSFTAEPYGYPITKLTATASTAQNGMGPEKTIDGSGLTGDTHGSDPMTMWMSTGAQPNWIQYQFDKAYKLNDLKVWNSNQPVEGYLGFGAKKVTVEYSADGTTWKALDNVPDFGRGTGLPGYAANTTVKFGGVTAKYVKLTINTTWGGMSPMTGLSEVQFSYVPVQAFAPQPATGATGLGVSTTLSWRSGREAASHKVFFGTDQAAVTNGTASAKTLTSHTFDPGALAYGTTYYWKVDEVNTVTYPGDVWKFTTQEFVAVDDFESYDDLNNRIYDTWIDGMTDSKSGSVVGYLTAPFAEQTILHGGLQAMPLAYDNTKSPFYSEATRDLGTPQDWTGNGATHMNVWFRGYPAVAGVAVTETTGKMTLTGGGTDIWNNSDDFTFAYKTLTGDGSIVARVVSIGAGTNTWAKGGVMVRDSLNGGSTFLDMVMTANTDGAAGNGASVQYRLTTNGACANTDASTLLKLPYWVKIQRTGDSVTGYVSSNGTTWTMMGTSQTIAMTAPVYVGLCVTAHQAGEQRTVQFDGIATTGSVTGSWQGAQINSPRYNDAAGLYVIVEDSTGKNKMIAHPDPAAAATGAWTQWKIALSDLTAAGVKTNKVKKLTIGAGDRNSPKSGAAGMLYIDDFGFGCPVK
jgi:hypothetical protein